MKFTLLEIRNLVLPLRKLAGQDLPIRTSWKLFNLTEQVDVLNEKIENFRIDLIKKYGTKVYEVSLKDDPEQKRIILSEAEYETHSNEDFSYLNAKIEVVDEEKLNTFISEFNSLLQTEEELNSEQISIEDLGDVKITPQEMYYIKKILI